MKTLKYPTLTLGLLCLMLFRPASAYDINLSLGNLCEYIGKIQTDDSGSTNLCSFNPYLASSVDIAMTEKFLFSPELGFSFPQSGRDENIRKMSLFALANAKYKFSEFHLIAGAGLFFTRISSEGGIEELNNGTSTSSFFLPDSTIYTRNLIVNLGLGANLSKEWSVELHTYIFNLATSEDRAFSLAINGSYHFGEF